MLQFDPVRQEWSESVPECSGRATRAAPECGEERAGTRTAPNTRGLATGTNHFDHTQPLKPITMAVKSNVLRALKRFTSCDVSHVLAIILIRANQVP